MLGRLGSRVKVFAGTNGEFLERLKSKDEMFFASSVIFILPGLKASEY
jgi:hypothetical protein